MEEHKKTAYSHPMLHAPYDADNPFALILDGKLPAARILETPRTLAIMDAFPQSRGHCLVIPKAPARNLLDVSRKDLSAVTDSVQVVVRAVEKALKPDGIVITQFNGAPAGQTVFHLHVHIIPRYSSAAEAPHGGGQASMEELQKLADLIKSHL